MLVCKRRKIKTLVTYRISFQILVQLLLRCKILNSYYLHYPQLKLQLKLQHLPCTTILWSWIIREQEKQPVKHTHGRIICVVNVGS